MIPDFHNILLSNVKKLVPRFFDKERYVVHYENLQRYLRLGLKVKKNTSRIRIQSVTMVKTIYRLQHIQKDRCSKKCTQRWKSVVKTNEQDYIRNEWKRKN